MEQFITLILLVMLTVLGMGLTLMAFVTLMLVLADRPKGQLYVGLVLLSGLAVFGYALISAPISEAPEVVESATQSSLLLVPMALPL